MEEIKLLPCTCGCTKPQVIMAFFGEESPFMWYVKCPWCGKRSEPGVTDFDVAENWNKKLEETKNDFWGRYKVFVKAMVKDERRFIEGWNYITK